MPSSRPFKLLLLAADEDGDEGERPGGACSSDRRRQQKAGYCVEQLPEVQPLKTENVALSSSYRIHQELSSFYHASASFVHSHDPFESHLTLVLMTSYL